MRSLNLTTPPPGAPLKSSLRAAASRPAPRTLLVLGALAATICLPGAASAAVAAPRAPAAAPSARVALPAAAGKVALLSAPAGADRVARPAGAARAQVPAQPSAPGGICQVPGIGDIGGLLGFCSSGSGLFGALDNICQPSVPTPEPATGGIDALIKPPASAGQPAAAVAPPPAPAAGQAARPGGQRATLYGSYGMAGQSWAAFDLKCSDMASLIGNNVAGVVFDAAKALDRVTITVYQSAAGPGILAWLTGAVNKLITSLGNAVYFPYLAPVVILGAIWLAWQGLIRKRATRSIEGTLWMVIACAAAIWLIGRPADFTGFGKSVSDGIGQTLNVAFAKLPAPQQSSCVPVARTDPQAQAGNFAFSPGNGIVDANANELWTVLVCKPWLDGEFGTTQYAAPGKGHPTVVNLYGRQLLWAQAIAANEKPTSAVITAKQDTYQGIANSLKQRDPAVYPLFTGKQWTTRLEIGFAALFAALLAGVLVLLIAITLIVLKLGFLLLLIAGPFFLIVGTHPGFGRVIALRWAELLVGVLLKQAAIALVLSVLLYAYSLIMGTSDAVLPWALKILMISLVTVAVFIYRKPFTHLFSAVGYGVIGSRERAEVQLARAGSSGARNTLDAASVAIPGFAAYRAARWARRNPAQAASLAAQVATAGSAAGVAGAAAGAAAGGSGGAGGEADGPDLSDVGPDEAAQVSTGTRPGITARGRVRPGAGATNGGRTPPPLDLPPRHAEGGPAAPSGWARGRAGATGRFRDGSPGPGGNDAGTGRGAPSAPAGRGTPRSAPSGNAGGAGNGASRAPSRPHGAPRTPWPGVAPRAHGGGSARPASPPQTARTGNGPRSQAGQPLGGQPVAGQQVENGAPQDDAPPGPFWLRPIRRRK